MPRKLKKVRVEVYDPIQNYLDLAGYCRFFFDGDIGAYLLKKSPEDPPTFVFGWELEGIHSYTPLEELQERIDRAGNGLKDFPPGDSLMLYQFFKYQLQIKHPEYEFVQQLKQ